MGDTVTNNMGGNFSDWLIDGLKILPLFCYDDNNFTPGDMKSIWDRLVMNKILLPNVTPFI